MKYLLMIYVASFFLSLIFTIINIKRMGNLTLRNFIIAFGCVAIPVLNTFGLIFMLLIYLINKES